MLSRPSPWADTAASTLTGSRLSSSVHCEPLQIIGERIDRKPASEADHFIRCRACGDYFDMRDLAQVFEPAGPLPHPTRDRLL